MGDLPDGSAWHHLAAETWAEWFASEMSTKWLRVDWIGLRILLVLHDTFWKTGDLEVAKEIRLQRAQFGLTPQDRGRLQWEIAKGEEAEHRLKAGKPVVKAGTVRDPRAFLKGLK
jgi:hypothetical protein